MILRTFMACITMGLAGFIAGCSSTKPKLVSPIDFESIELPIKFSGYRSFYTFIALNEYSGMYSKDKDVVLKMAADSSTEIITVDDKGMQDQYLYLIKPHYYNGGIYDQIRGAQGNGHYYILRPLATKFTELDTDKGFELIGLLSGNSCRFTHETGKPAFITHWHMSAAESPQTIYEWNGK